MEKFKRDIKAHALTDRKNEVCGLVVLVNDAPEIVPCKNIAYDKEGTWEISPEDYIKCFNDGNLLASYHSHPTTIEEHTTADKSMSELLELPSYIYSCPADRFSFYEPCGFEAPLIGRQFVLGLHDCIGLVLDYYHKELGITLEPFIRTPKQVIEGFDDLLEYCTRNGLVRVFDQRKDDIILISLNGKGRINHSGIDKGEGLILHQLIGRVSRIDNYSGSGWEKDTVMRVRHQSRL